MTPQVVCLGETMALVAPDPPVPLADAHSLVLGCAGAESNVAVALAGLGVGVSWCSRLGDDALGCRVLAELRAAGVDTGLVRLSSTRPTGVMFKDPGPDGTGVLYYRRGSAASTMDERDVDRALAEPPRLLHLSGITPALSPACSAAFDHALDRAHAAGVEVSFDVNHRPALWPDVGAAATRLADAARRCAIVFVGLDEAERLWGTSTALEVRAHLPEPGVLVVKDGGGSATSFTGDEWASVPGLPIEIVEPIGAGDAFAAGWLFGYLAGRTPVEALRLGHLVAAGSLASTTDHARVTAAVVAGADANRPWPPPQSPIKWPAEPA
jgi:2-dehydro-3-deoxygluconokinase